MLVLLHQHNDRQLIGIATPHRSLFSFPCPHALADATKTKNPQQHRRLLCFVGLLHSLRTVHARIEEEVKALLSRFGDAILEVRPRSAPSSSSSGPTPASQ